MATPSQPDGGSRWNLGKTPKSKPPKPPPESAPPEKQEAKPAAERKPAAEAKPVAAAPASAGEKQSFFRPKIDYTKFDPPDVEEEPAPGSARVRPAPLPRSPREVVSHPITLTAIALLASLALIFFVLGRMGSPGQRFEAPRTVRDTRSGASRETFGGSGRVPAIIDLDSSYRDMPELETARRREARLLEAAGQMFEGLSMFRRNNPRASATDYQFVPPMIIATPLPSDDAGVVHAIAFDRRSEVAQEFIEAGQDVIRNAADRDASPDNLLALGRRLQLEGRVVLLREAEQAGSDALRDAEQQLQTLRQQSSDADVLGVIRRYLPGEFGEAIAEVRGRHFKP